MARKKISCRFAPEVEQVIVAEAKRRQESYADVIRDLVDEGLAARETPVVISGESMEQQRADTIAALGLYMGERAL